MRDLLSYSPKCCVEPPAVPPEFDCFIPELGQEYCKLVRRYQNQVTKNKRILALAEPKTRTPKVRQPCICPEVALRKVEIVREQPIHTRTEQLAYPQPSRLFELKKRQSFRTFHHVRKEMVNRTLRKSLLSLYSRLASVPPPQKPKEEPKWDQYSWEEHLRRIKVLSKAKPEVQPEKPVVVPSFRRRGRGRDGGERTVDLRRMKKLAKPRTYEDTSLPPWQLTNNMRTYNPSKRILEISKPRITPFSHEKRESEQGVTRQALRYRATSRIKELATPSRVYKKPELKETPFKTSPNALKAKTTKRIIELAEPKDYTETHIRTHPYKVSPAALKAKITPRLIELAKPKEYSSI